MAGKRSSKLLRMTEELACRAHVFAASVYWEAQLPKGESAPDLNELVSISGVVNLHRCQFEPSPLTGRKVASCGRTEPRKSCQTTTATVYETGTTKILWDMSRCPTVPKLLDRSRLRLAS